MSGALRGVRTAVWGVTALGMAAGANAAPPTPPVTAVPAVKIPSGRLSLQTRRAAFEAVWNRINEQYYDPTFGGVDWNAVHKKYAPLVNATDSDAEFYGLLSRMLRELKQSHFAIIPPQRLSLAEVASAKPGKAATNTNKPAGSAPSSDKTVTKDTSAYASLKDGLPGGGSGETGAVVGFVKGEVVVLSVHDNSPAQKAGLRPGDALVSVNGAKPTEVPAFLRAMAPTLRQNEQTVTARSLAQRFLTGEPGATLTLSVKTENDQMRDLPIVLSAAPTVPNVLPGFPALHVEFESRRLENGVGYVRFTPFATVTLVQIRKALEGMGDAPGIVLDLRGNPGGLLPTTYAIAGMLSPKKGNLGTMQLRGPQLVFPVTPQNPMFAGPVAVLTDELSASCSEVLAGGLQTMGRAKVIGRQTPGMVLPSVTYGLPGGARLQYVIADFKTTKGVLLEGRGVVPDKPVELSRELLYKQGDPDIRAALDYIESAKTAAPSASSKES